MAELTLEELAKRVAELECKVAALTDRRQPKDWRRTVGMFEGSDFMAQVDAQIIAEREAERQAARAGVLE